MERGRLTVSESPFSISFIAPPELADPPAAAQTPRAVSGGTTRSAARSSPAPADGQGSVRLTAQARAAASRLGVSTSDVSRVLASPETVGPDERDSSRMVFRRGDLEVVTGRDGVVIFLRRSRKSRP